MDKTATRNSRLILLSIVGLPVTMVLAATWLWFFVSRGDIDLVDLLGTSNHGVLLSPPTQLNDFSYQNQFGAQALFADSDPQWTLLVPVPAQCDGICLSTLYLTRQIHLGLGKEFGRIRRVYVSPERVNLDLPLPAMLSDSMAEGVTQLGEYLEGYHKAMPLLHMNARDYQTTFGQSAAGMWYVVDPASWMMMSYESTVHYKDVTSDLKFLLKNSAD